MAVEIIEIGPDRLGDYARVPIAFQVKSLLKLDVVGSGLGGIKLIEEDIEPAYLKDYDTSVEGGPEEWRNRFNLRNFGLFMALEDGRPVGAAAVAFDTPDIHMLSGRKDMAVLWDIRVRPDTRRKGIGSEIFTRVTAWARAKGCSLLKVETQNVNVPACRFYAKQGARLGEINRYAYAGHPGVSHEVMLIWYLNL
jgi:GNAT superfamily N-acetyltransferase